ncbi:hypothetical protein BJ322DRAFT_1020833 [Thelephora terrestris]|uniref:Uncharacterized protein n=1 Tax=Thelephora terrestris TaxID=56493 RepID=A0A9P6L796_9AGAM|nr:hypothetical protein BJ322DRAFT_1020833 [Thelephora terrestris]
MHSRLSKTQQKSETKENWILPSGLTVNKFKTYPPLCPQFDQWWDCGEFVKKLSISRVCCDYIKENLSMWWAHLVQFVKESLGFVKEVLHGQTYELVQNKFKTYPLIKVWAKWWGSAPSVRGNDYGVFPLFAGEPEWLGEGRVERGSSGCTVPKSSSGKGRESSGSSRKPEQARGTRVNDSKTKQKIGRQ